MVLVRLRCCWGNPLHRSNGVSGRILPMAVLQYCTSKPSHWTKCEYGKVGQADVDYSSHIGRPHSAQKDVFVEKANMIMADRTANLKQLSLRLGAREGHVFAEWWTSHATRATRQLTDSHEKLRKHVSWESVALFEAERSNFLPHIVVRDKNCWTISNPKTNRHFLVWDFVTSIRETIPMLWLLHGRLRFFIWQSYL